MCLCAECMVRRSGYTLKAPMRMTKDYDDSIEKIVFEPKDRMPTEIIGNYGMFKPPEATMAHKYTFIDQPKILQKTKISSVKERDGE